MVSLSEKQSKVAARNWLPKATMEPLISRFAVDVIRCARTGNGHVMAKSQGLHNLESKGLDKLAKDLSGRLDQAMAHGWIDGVLDAYAAIPGAQFGTQIEAISHVIDFVRGMVFQSAQKSYSKDADTLVAVIEQNRDHRLAVYIELVDQPSFSATLARYTVWKGTLFEVNLKGKAIVCWHPDKDFKPQGAVNVMHTKYSQLGRRQRRRETAAEN
jgi:hypothetical protein